MEYVLEKSQVLLRAGVGWMLSIWVDSPISSEPRTDSGNDVTMAEGSEGPLYVYSSQ